MSDTALVNVFYDPAGGPAHRRHIRTLKVHHGSIAADQFGEAWKSALAHVKERNPVAYSWSLTDVLDLLEQRGWEIRTLPVLTVAYDMPATAEERHANLMHLASRYGANDTGAPPTPEPAQAAANG